MSAGLDSECGALTVLALYLLSPDQAAGLQRWIQQQLKSIGVRGIIVLLISIIVSASAPRFTEFGGRLSSFEGNVSAEVAEVKASEGWFLKPGGHGQEVCFSCGVVSSQFCHQSCAFRSVTSLLGKENQPGGCLETPAKLWTPREVDALCQFLKGPRPSFAETFGYPRPVIAFAIIKDFCKTNALPQTVGGLIDLVQNLSDDWSEVAIRVNLEPLVTKVLAGELSVVMDLSSTHVQPAQKPAAVAMEEPKPKEDECSDQCSVCRNSQINRVILPCRHLSACELCLKTREFCPTCHGRIMATVVAYLC